MSSNPPITAVEISPPPEYASVRFEDDLPPPYPDDEQPPPYSSVTPMKLQLQNNNSNCSNNRGNNNNLSTSNNNSDCGQQNVSGNSSSVVVSACTEENIVISSSTNTRSNSTRKKPLAPRFVAWFDIILNCPVLLIFMVDVIIRKWKSLPTLWMAAYIFLWIRAAYKLHKSANIYKSRNERRKLTEAWVKVNSVLLGSLGLLSVAGIFIFIDGIAKDDEVFVAVIIAIFVSFVIRLIFFYVIRVYIRTL